MPAASDACFGSTCNNNNAARQLPAILDANSATSERNVHSMQTRNLLLCPTHTCSRNRANAHATCDSIGLISYACCLGLSLLIFKRVSQPKIANDSLKTPIFGVQGHSRSSMLVPPERSSAVLVIISSKSVSICNRSDARRANSGKITIC